MTRSHNIKMWQHACPMILIYYRIRHNYVYKLCEAPELKYWGKKNKTRTFRFCIFYYGYFLPSIGKIWKLQTPKRDNPVGRLAKLVY